MTPYPIDSRVLHLSPMCQCRLFSTFRYGKIPGIFAECKVTLPLFTGTEEINNMASIPHHENIGIQTFEELVAVAESAIDKRMNQSEYSRITTPILGKVHIRLHRGKKTLKGFMTNVPFALHVYDRKACKQMYPLAIRYSDNLIADFRLNTEEYRASYELFDEQGKKTFINLLAGEMLMDGRFGLPFQEPEGRDHSYYCVNVKSDSKGEEKSFINKDEIFVDCGAYKGDIFDELTEKGKLPKKYFGFEPTPENYRIAKQTLTACGVEGFVYNVGVYNFSGELHFSVGANTSAAHIAENGDISIRVEKIDNIIKEPVSFIKMDVEGSEAEALEGASELIRLHKPKLAISMYHKHTDYRILPLLIKKLNPDYSCFYLKYPSDVYGSDGFLEVILFAE